MNSSPVWRLEQSYAELPALFFSPAEPTPVAEPSLVIFNQALAEALGLPEDKADVYAGNRLPPGARPLAQAYAGHQFGNFTALGDGRAILLGEQITPQGQRFDIQLKGPGPTPYSRRGDGRAALGPMLREYVISEAMHALRIPTTRSLAVVTTGEAVWRQDGALPGAVLTRVAASHLRVGTFEWAAAHQDIPALQALAEYTRERHYPDLSRDAATLFTAIAERQAQLLAQWMLVGFIHGVMNTDNMALSGETIDYGPCAFMDVYDPATVFSSIDRRGRYAYGRQPAMAHWNLARLAEAMLPLFHEDNAQAVEIANALIEPFESRYQMHWRNGMRAKLGLFTEEVEDVVLMNDLLHDMQQRGADFTNTFADLTHGRRQPDAWSARWQARLTRQPQTEEEVTERMRQSNPAVIPRNHKVEEALGAAQLGDLKPLHSLLDAVTHPWDHPRAQPEFQQPRSSPGYRTFCGT